MLAFLHDGNSHPVQHLLNVLVRLSILICNKQQLCVWLSADYAMTLSEPT